MKEVDVGPPVIAWLEEQRFEVFQEVEAGAGIADVVGVCGPLLVVVELKVGLTFELLQQARRWRGAAHSVFVAYPRKARSRSMWRGDGAEAVFADYGVGVLAVDVVGGFAELVARPAFNRRAEVGRVRRYLREEQKTHAAAGSQGAARWSPFKATSAAVRRYVDEHEGCTVRELVEHVEHHYASDAGARAHLVVAIKRGWVDGVRVELDGRTPKLFKSRLDTL